MENLQSDVCEISASFGAHIGNSNSGLCFILLAILRGGTASKSPVTSGHSPACISIWNLSSAMAVSWRMTSKSS